MTKITEKIELNGRDLVIETGEIARQAGGSVKVTYGETVVLAACCTAEVKANLGFFPLTIDYRERTYAAGKIPGGFFKREGRPQEKETISARLIDRPIRPLFPEGYGDEVQVMITILSFDGENDADIPAMIGASCAVSLSSAPFNGPIGAVRIGKIGDNFIVNPTCSEMNECEFDLVIAGTEAGISMLEGKSNETSEETILKAIETAEPIIAEIVQFQRNIVKLAEVEKMEFTPPELDEDLKKEITGIVEDKIMKVYKGSLSKHERSKNLKVIKKELLEQLIDSQQEDDAKESMIKTIFSKIEKEVLRKLLIEEKIRVDGRGPEDLRPITCISGVLPRTHGSGIFTKGETQSLSVVTLGTKHDQQIMDALEGEYKKNFMLHYNFPPYSVGEVRPNRGTSRREIGHGILAEKAISYALPEREIFPYTIRLVSDILESNGSSSMATVCAGTIALMDAGVPLKKPVAGVGMGIIDDVILTDIMGDEDHAGDMDFKVAGTKEGLTAIQMDIKISGISKDILKKALEQAKKARIATLEEIEKVISEPREDISQYAPRVATLTINPKKIGILIGPGGKNIKAIQEATETVIEIDDDGTVAVSSASKDNLAKAVDMVKNSTADAEAGQTYEGIVKGVVDFGAFVEILPGKEGLVHISELAPFRVNKVTDILNMGDKVKVKCLGVDERGKIKLSRVKALTDEEVNEEKDKNSN